METENPQPHHQVRHLKSWFRYFQFEKDTASVNDVRNILLIVATLIAGVTFQAGVNPPGGVWQDNGRGHRAGTAIYASQKEAFYVFLISNTLALATSVVLILSLTHRFPFQFEIFVASVSMIVTYGSAVFAVTPDESHGFRYVLTAAAVPPAIRLLLHVWYKFKGSLLHEEKTWHSFRVEG